MTPCFWHEEADGTRYLIPGCVSRAQDPDGEACTCPTLDEQLARAREEIAALKKTKKGLQNWHDAIVAAVYAHPDGIQIMKNAADRAAESRNVTPR